MLVGGRVRGDYTLDVAGYHELDQRPVQRLPVLVLAVRDRVSDALGACASGRELVEQGWPQDVEVAAELDQSDAVPVLREGAYTAYGG